jgi:hypothetical protein
MPDKNLLPQTKEEIEFDVRRIDAQKLPKVIQRYYNEQGKLVGMDILVSSETIPVTGKEYAEWYQATYPQ